MKKIFLLVIVLFAVKLNAMWYCQAFSGEFSNPSSAGFGESIIKKTARKDAMSDCIKTSPHGVYCKIYKCKQTNIKEK